MLLDRLNEYVSRGIYPMHMPGHKRNAPRFGAALSYTLDITEIPGFDNLSDPRGILREMSELAARLYGSARAFPLVGGSTCGILAAITACVPRGGRLVMARASHLSVYNAAELNELEAAYIMPQADAQTGISGSVTPDSVSAALSGNPDARLVVITSPTYEGVISDIAGIAAAAHRHGVPLMVDAAHGAHLGFTRDFPDSAIHAGADIVVMSLHKTLPALTQCALLHVSGKLVDIAAVARCVNIFQTSSPSYVLLTSVDSCLRLIEREGAGLFDDYALRLRRFRDSVSGLARLRVMGASPAFFALDPGKIVVSSAACGMTGPEMAEHMRSVYRVEPEMAYTDYLVAMTSVADTDEGFARLADAVTGLDAVAPPLSAERVQPDIPLPRRADTISGAVRRGGMLRQTHEAAGMMALEYVWAYPPGIPIIAPGEVLGEGAVPLITALAQAGVTVMSTRGAAPGQIYCCEIPG